MATVTPLNAFVFEDYLLKLIEVSEAMQNAIVRVVNSENAQFNDDIDKFQNNLGTIITTGIVGEEIQKLFTSYENVGETAQNRLQLGVELFDFGSTDSPLPFSGAQNLNNQTINLAIQTNSLSLAYNNAVQIPFGNTEELNSVIMILDEQFEKVTSQTLDSNSRLALIEQRVKAMEFFSSLELESVIEIQTKVIASTVLSYQYYGDSTRSDEIVDLNAIQITGFIEGSVNILTT